MTSAYNADEVQFRYFVDDIHSSHSPGTRLRNIIDRLESGAAIPEPSLNYLRQLGLHALGEYVVGRLTWDEFLVAAQVERAIRIPTKQSCLARGLVEAKSDEVRAIERMERERQLFAELEARKNADPRYASRARNRTLRERYGIECFVDEELYPTLMDTLHRIDQGDRFRDSDYTWLSTEGKDYFLPELRAAYHSRESEFHLAEYQRTADPWSAVNASRHLRKCDKSLDAVQLIASVPSDSSRARKLQAALRTTLGGGLRDLRRYAEALQKGSEAHDIRPQDYRPCTLLGAINIETGEYEIGIVWYEKAKERGAPEGTFDSDLRQIYRRATEADRQRMKAFFGRSHPDALRVTSSLDRELARKPRKQNGESSRLLSHSQPSPRN